MTSSRVSKRLKITSTHVVMFTDGDGIDRPIAVWGSFIKAWRHAQKIPEGYTVEVPFNTEVSLEKLGFEKG